MPSTHIISKESESLDTDLTITKIDLRLERIEQGQARTNHVLNIPAKKKIDFRSIEVAYNFSLTNFYKILYLQLVTDTQWLPDPGFLISLQKQRPFL